MLADLHPRIPCVTEILNATQSSSKKSSRKYTPSSAKQKYANPFEQAWCVQERRERGIAVHAALEALLKKQSLQGYCDEVLSYVASVKATGLLERIEYPVEVEKSLICRLKLNGESLPYSVRLDALVRLKSSWGSQQKTVIDWYVTDRPIFRLDGLLDKMAQIAAQVKACEFNGIPIEQALIVVAQPSGQAKTFTLNLDQIENTFSTDYLPRLRQFYNQQ